MTDRTHYGAHPADWDTLTFIHGLTRDLLPVVSNTTAAVSPTSKMRDVGKVPSRYNNMRMVVGFPNWTQHEATAEHIDRWRAQADYGICLQTREARAIDIDLTDPLLASQVTKSIDVWFKSEGIVLPRRTRANSSKLLMLFRMPGEFAKRVMVLRRKEVDENGEVSAPAQAIEFLANGQQFICSGTHPSGTRYEWNTSDGGLPDEIPELTPEQFEGMWYALERIYAVETASGVLRKRGDTKLVHDEMIDILERRQLVLGYGKDGQAFIECPWKSEHSMDSGITETAYFPKGTNGYERGHFKCMHASHAGKKDEDFETTLGLLNDMFEVLPPRADEVPMPSLRRNKLGQVEGTISQILQAIAHPTFNLGWRITFDQFTGEAMVDKYDGDGLRPVTDVDFTTLAANFERQGFKSCSLDLMRRAVLKHASDNAHDSAIDWANALPPWDGKPRVQRFMDVYYGTEPSPYAEALGLYWWTALAGRVLRPGVKADMMPILFGAQGTGKSTSLVAMVPSEKWFLESDFHGIDDDDQKRKIRGTVLVEFAEMSGMGKKEKESVKKYLSSTSDRWVEKYQTQRTEFLRRCVFVGTCNDNEILSDPTGERRFLPIEVGTVDVLGIQRDRHQLWAEAIMIYKERGIMWKDAQELAKAEHNKFKVDNLAERDVELALFQPNDDGIAWIEQLDGIISMTELMAAVSPLGRSDPALRRSVKAALLGFGARPALRRRKRGGVVRGYEIDRADILRHKVNNMACDLV